MVLKELKENKELIEKGQDANSSSGSDDCPSEDNLSKDVLKQILPIRNKKKIMPPVLTTKAKENGKSIFGLTQKKKETVHIDFKPKEDKKKESPMKLDKKREKSVKQLPPLPIVISNEDQKEKQGGTGEATITYIDASTQTEKIDFQKARYF